MAKKRRRVNVQFLTIAAAGLAGLLVLGAVLYKAGVFKPSPDKFRRQAEEQIAEKKWDEALKSVGNAIRYTRTPDPTLWIMLGDVCSQLTVKDPEMVGQMYSAYQQASDIDPTNPDVARRMLQIQRDSMDLSPRSGVKTFDAVRDSAKRVMDLDPKDISAQLAFHGATLQQWLSDISTDQAKVDEALAGMQKVREADPANAEAPLYLARAKLFLGMAAAREGDNPGAKKLFGEAEQVMIDALKGQESNALIHYNYARTLQALSNADRPTPDRAAAQAPGGSIADLPKEDQAAITAQALGYLKRSLEEASKAYSLVKPEQPEYAEIGLMYAQLEMGVPRVDAERPREQLLKDSLAGRERAEAVYREILKNKPQEQSIRIRLAELVGNDPRRRDEAIQILSETGPRHPDWVGIKGSVSRNLESQSQIVLANMRLNQLSLTRDKDKRQQLINDIQAGYDKLAAVMNAENPWVQQIKGRLQYAKGQVIDAIPTMNRALSMFPAEMPQRYELMYELANAYLAAGQTGEAKRLLRDVLAVSPLHDMSRVLLADLLIREGNIKGTLRDGSDGAWFQIDELAKVRGENDVTVSSLRVRAMAERDPSLGTASGEGVAPGAGTTQPATDAMRDRYAKMPESSLQERFEKARVAFSVLQDSAEAIRLLEMVNAEKPDQLEFVEVLVRLYQTNKQPEKALALLERTIPLHPDNKALQRARDQLLKPEQAADIRRKQIDEIANPLQKELALVQFYAEQGNDQEAQKHAEAAIKADPEHPRALDLQFNMALAAKDWERAAGLADKLGKLNVDSADGQRYRIRLAAARGDAAAAEEQAKKLTEIRSEFDWAWLLLAQTQQARAATAGSAEQRTAKLEEAINNYVLALQRKVDNDDAIRGLVECYIALDRPGKPEAIIDGKKQEATDAKKYIEMGQRAFPHGAVFKEMAIAWELQYGDPQVAIAARERATKDRPQDPLAWRDYGIAYLTAAQLRSSKSADGRSGASASTDPLEYDKESKANLSKARDIFADGAKRFPDDPGFQLQVINLYLLLKDVPAAEKEMLAFTANEKFKDKPDTAIFAAEFYTRANLPDKAEKALRDALAAKPGNATIIGRLITALTAQKKFDEAIKVLDENPSMPGNAKSRIDVLLMAGRFDDAAKYIDQQLAAAPTPEMEILRARIDLATGKFAEGRSRIDRVYAANPNLVDAVYLRGLCTLADPNGDLNAAIEDLSRVVAARPDRQDARVQLAEALFKRKRTDEAIQQMEIAVRGSVTDKPNRIRLLDMYASTEPPRWMDAERMLKEIRLTPQFSDDPDFMQAEANMWLARKDPNRALGLVRGAMAKLPDNPALARTYYEILIETKDFRTLMAESDRLLKAQPNAAWVYRYRTIARVRGAKDRAGALAEANAGIALARKANDAPTISSLILVVADEVSPAEAEKLLQPLDPGDLRWQMLRASVLDRAGNVPGALAIMEKVLSTPSLSSTQLEQALQSTGYLYLKLSPPNLAKAIETYRRLMKESPNNFTAMNNLAALLVEPGPDYSPQEALKYSTRVYEDSRRQGITNPLISDTHGWALINADKVDEGTQILLEALRKQKFVDGYYHLGEGYLKKNPPMLTEAERALLDANLVIADDERAGRPVDPTLKKRVQAALDRVKQMKR